MQVYLEYRPRSMEVLANAINAVGEPYDDKYHGSIHNHNTQSM
jgi:hypothetical protein